MWIAALALLGACSGDDEQAARPHSGIYYGDLHVHSTNSVDVFALKLPLFGHDGRVSPLDHCHYARFCSQLDFWAITDHQEGAPPTAWDESVDAVEQCTTLYGDDLVTFAGFEWQQSAEAAEENWGHKNVILPGATADELPRRAIASASQVTSIEPATIEAAVSVATTLDAENAAIYEEVGDYALAGAAAEACPEGVDTRDLPPDCIEEAAAPADLYDKLDEWGFPALVIPHGTTWGRHHPPLFSWEHQLTPEHHHPEYQTLLEIYSGHGSMEEYRTWRSIEVQDDGSVTCAAPSDDFEPCCWRAGILAGERSEACQADPASAACEQVKADARQAFVDAGRAGTTTVDAAPEEWLDCDQCRDCFQPASEHRPLGSAQAALAMSHFHEDGEVGSRYHFGFLGSTDTHAVGPGAGYKEGKEMSDVVGAARLDWEAIVDLMLSEIFHDWERQNTFFHSGGLVAVHAEDRSREAIWEALEERRVYGTTGERIELWFDLTSGEGATMGGAAEVGETPTFAVKAVGSYQQKPGCPEWVPDPMVDGPCMEECFNPTSERNLLDRIEVVRIRPQASPDEDLAALIDDPFLVLDCEGKATCEVSFDDPDFVPGGRDALYYVRAVQHPTGQLNHDDLRCETDAEGNCLSVDICRGGERGEGDDCIQDGGERAWASPIYLSPR